MQVEVRLFSGLEKLVSGARYGQPLYIDISSGMTVGELLNRLGIPLNKIFSVILNGRHAEQNQVLQPGDRVALFPPLAGG